VGTADYVAVTHDYRKKQQLCHIIMLNVYDEQNDDKVEVCATVVTFEQG